jgi:hypothetical protein
MRSYMPSGKCRFSGSKLRGLGEEMIEAVGEVVGEVLSENGEEEIMAEDLREKATLLWANVHGLVYL